MIMNCNQIEIFTFIGHLGDLTLILLHLFLLFLLVHELLGDFKIIFENNNHFYLP